MFSGLQQRWLKTQLLEVWEPHPEFLRKRCTQGFPIRGRGFWGPVLRTTRKKESFFSVTVAEEAKMRVKFSVL